jgi:glutamate dehydrogenase/leucine dehydrogenase
MTPPTTRVVVQGAGNVGGIGARLFMKPVIKSSPSRIFAAAFIIRME